MGAAVVAQAGVPVAMSQPFDPNGLEWKLVQQAPGRRFAPGQIGAERKGLIGAGRIGPGGPNNALRASAGLLGASKLVGPKHDQVPVVGGDHAFILP